MSFFFAFQTNGFFIESGAFDGEYLSNSLFFERFRNWTGLLVEPNPFQFKRLMNKNRKAYAINACLSEKNYSSVVSVNFRLNFLIVLYCFLYSRVIMIKTDRCLLLIVMYINKIRDIYIDVIYVI
jgi:hypothetical protein